jgi:hypothetical protein
VFGYEADFELYCIEEIKFVEISEKERLEKVKEVKRNHIMSGW